MNNKKQNPFLLKIWSLGSESNIEVVLPCAEKLSFDTKSQAEGTAATAQWQHGTKLKPYICHHCHIWHLASN